MLNPPAPEVLVQSHEIREAVEPRRDQNLLAAVQVGLRGEHAQVVVHSAAVARPRQIEAALEGGYVALERGNLIVVRAARSEVVGHLAKCNLNGLLILSDANVPLDAREI